MMSDDLIRREDAIKAIEELPNAYNGWSDAYDKAHIIGTLEEVPSADRPQDDEFKNFDRGDLIALIEAQKERIGELLADRPQGEWIYGEHNVAMCDGYRCNRCDFFVPWDYEHKFIDFINDYHFCPNCGARMKGADDE